jgi:acetyl esterase
LGTSDSFEAMPLDQPTRKFLDDANAKPGPAPGEMSLEDFRAAVEPFRKLGFEREEVARVDELTVPRHGQPDVQVRLFRPAAPAPLPIVVWAHGGSWVRVTVDLLENHFRMFANRSGCALAAVDYELSPESRFPRAIEEVYAAACWLKREAAPLGLDAARIAVGGESSGANLALLDRRRRLVGFTLQALIVPVLDTRFQSSSWEQLGEDYLLTRRQLEWALEQYAPGVDREDPLLCPVCAESLEGLPPAQIFTGEFDPLKDDGAAFARRLAEAHVDARLTEVEGLIHHAVMAPRLLSAGRSMLIDAAQAIGAALRGDGGA